MLKRTHLALGLAAGLYFFPHIKTDKILFLIIVIAASVLPDLESGFSAPKKHKGFSLKSTNLSFHKNWLFHTYTLLIIVSILLTISYPVIAFPFFLGYSFHLFLDSFSSQGISPFWPLKKRSTGSIV